MRQSTKVELTVSTLTLAFDDEPSFGSDIFGERWRSISGGADPRIADQPAAVGITQGSARLLESSFRRDSFSIGLRESPTAVTQKPQSKSEKKDSAILIEPYSLHPSSLTEVTAGSLKYNPPVEDFEGPSTSCIREVRDSKSPDQQELLILQNIKVHELDTISSSAVSIHPRMQSQRRREKMEIALNLRKA